MKLNFASVIFIFKSKKIASTLVIILISLNVAISLVNLLINDKKHQQITSVRANNSVDLLTQSDWRYAPSTKKLNGNLEIYSSRSSIVKLNNSSYIENYPINLDGPIINTTSSFELNFGMSNIKGEANVMLYGEPPIILDENRYDQSSIRISIKDGRLSVSRLIGRDINYITPKSTIIKKLDQYKLTLISENKNFKILINGDKIIEFPAQNILASGKLWLGFDAGKSTDSWQLTELRLRSQDSAMPKLTYLHNLEPVQSPEESFRNLLKNKRSNILIGTAISAGPLSADEQYYQIAGGWYNSWTTENALKMQFVHPQKDIYNFSEADLIVNLAQKNQIKVHGHALVFGEANPAWVNQLAIDNPNMLAQVMTEHIGSVVSHYKGRISSWDVVNEPLSDYEAYPLKNNIWFKAMGEEYISKAFTMAHNADPTADLYINEYGLESDGKRWDYFLNLIDKLQAQNIPINGVGFQAHVYEPGDEINPIILKKHFRQLKQRGLKVRISEMDVYGRNTDLQGVQFSEILKVCILSDNCTSFNMWGVTEKYGSTAIINEDKIELGDGLLFGVDYKPFGAVKLMQNVIRSQ